MKNSEGFQVVEDEERSAYILLLSELKALRDNLVIFKKGFTEIPLGIKGSNVMPNLQAIIGLLQHMFRQPSHDKLVSTTIGFPVGLELLLTNAKNHR